MKDEVLKILELLEKGVITSEEANSLIKEIKSSEEPEETTNTYNSYEQKEATSNKKGTSYTYDSKKIEDSLRLAGDKVNEFIAKIQPEVLKATQIAADKIAESSRKFSEKVDSKLNEDQKTKKTNSEVDDIINNYEEEKDYE